MTSLPKPLSWIWGRHRSGEEKGRKRDTKWKGGEERGRSTPEQKNLPYG